MDRPIAVKEQHEFELLNAKFPLRPIRNSEHNERAMSVCDELLDKRGKMSSVEKDYFDVLSMLIHSFESSAYADDELNLKPNEIIASIVEAQGLKQADLAKELDISTSRLSEFLSGKRRINLNLARKLADRFAISLDFLLSELE